MKIDPHTMLKLHSAIVAFDKRQERTKSYNIYAMGHYCGAMEKVKESVASGSSLARALYDNFNGRLLTTLEKSVGLEPTFGGGGHDRGRPD